MPQKKYYEKEKNCTTREKHFRNKYVEKKEEEAPEKNETETQRDERDNRQNRERGGGRARNKIKRRQIEERAIADVKAQRKKEIEERRKKRDEQTSKTSQWVKFERQHAQLKVRIGPQSPRILQTNFLRCERYRQNFYDERGYQKASYLQKGQKEPEVPFESQKKRLLRSQLLYSYELQYYLEKELQNFYIKVQEQIEEQLTVDRLLIGYLKSPQSVFSKLKEQIKVSSTFKAKLYTPTSPIVLIYEKTGQTQEECAAILNAIYPKIKEEAENGNFKKVQFYQASPRPFILIQANEVYNSKKVLVYAHSSLMSQSHFREPYLEYQRVYPGLNSLFRFIKIFFTMKGLTNFATDGIDDYSIFLMVLHSMQVLRRKKTDTFKEFQQISHAQDLIHFLLYYGFQHHYVGVSLSVARHDKLYQEFELSKQENLQKYYLEDILKPNQENPHLFTTQSGDFIPQLLMNDMFRPESVSNNFKKVSELKQICQRGIMALYQNLQCGAKKTCYSYQRISSVERWEQRNHRPCCLIRRLFKS